MARIGAEEWYHSPAVALVMVFTIGFLFGWIVSPATVSLQTDNVPADVWEMETVVGLKLWQLTLCVIVIALIALVLFTRAGRRMMRIGR